jgi:hypothetical protein
MQISERQRCRLNDGGDAGTSGGANQDLAIKRQILRKLHKRMKEFQVERDSSQRGEVNGGNET